MPSVVIDYEKCQNHAVCLDNCPVAVFEKEGDKVVVKNQDACTVCKICEESCPVGAVTVTE